MSLPADFRSTAFELGGSEGAEIECVLALLNSACALSQVHYLLVTFFWFSDNDKRPVPRLLH